jgi:hypothetical protein
MVRWLAKYKGSFVLCLCKLQHKLNSIAEERNVSGYDVNVLGGFTITKAPDPLEVPRLASTDRPLFSSTVRTRPRARASPRSSWEISSALWLRLPTEGCLALSPCRRLPDVVPASLPRVGYMGKGTSGLSWNGGTVRCSAMLF